VNRYYLPVIPLLGIVTTVTLQTQPVFALERSEIAAKAKEITVQIDGEETGTGTIIEHNGNTYTVITCWHVVDTPGNYRVITSDNLEHNINYQTIKHQSGVDIAVLQFTSNQNYLVAEIGDSQQINENTSIYIAGYPDPIPGIPVRRYDFGGAEINSLLTQSEKGYTIVHNKPGTPANSGGPILDSNARLIGINGQTATDGNTDISLGRGIPIHLYPGIKNRLPVFSGTQAAEELPSLDTLLASGRWKEANQKTWEMLLNTGDTDRSQSLNPLEVDNLDCQTLKNIDNQWYEYSNEQFGFRVQRSIYEATSAIPGKYESSSYNLFGETVGWRQSDRWLDYSNLSWSLDSPRGALPVWFTYDGKVSDYRYGLPKDDYCLSIGTTCSSPGASLAQKLQICGIGNQ
jgi:hypothetical protein